MSVMHHSTPSHEKRPFSRAFCNLVGFLDGHTYETGALEDRCLRMNAFFENSSQTLSNEASTWMPSLNCSPHLLWKQGPI